MRQLYVVALAVFLAVSLVLAHPSDTALGASPQATSTNLAVSTAPQLDQKGHAVNGQYLVVAVLTLANGQPVSNHQVAFFEQANFMGATRAVTLGTATTDATGNAAVTYQPAQAGSHTLLAQFLGDSQYTPSDAKVSLQVKATDLVAPFPSQSAPLASLQFWLTATVELAVVLFWVFLLSLFLWTLLGIWMAGRQTATGRVEWGARVETT